MGKKDNDDKNRHSTNPFNNQIQLCCDCGDCCLIHQQFTLEHNFSFDEITSVTVYGANGYEPACIPGQSADGVGTNQVAALAYPFETLIVSNIGANPFELEILEANGGEGTIKTVPPGSQMAFSAAFRQVNAIYPPDPIRALFN